MNTIYKYEINTEDLFELELPKAAKILTVQTQRDKPCLWVLVDTEQEKEKRLFRFTGTGHEIDKRILNNLEYIGTFQLNGGLFVGHLFEVLPVEKVLVKAMSSNFFG